MMLAMQSNSAVLLATKVGLQQFLCCHVCNMLRGGVLFPVTVVLAWVEGCSRAQWF